MINTFLAHIIPHLFNFLSSMYAVIGMTTWMNYDKIKGVSIEKKKQQQLKNNSCNDFINSFTKFWISWNYRNSELKPWNENGNKFGISLNLN